ncbi:hypothetical protein E2320_022670 [Naja naja]|nr:hypothetical protein E2320_022670 [Naja naja]
MWAKNKTEQNNEDEHSREENQHLRHFLNSALVKQLEEKTKVAISCFSFRTATMAMGLPRPARDTGGLRACVTHEGPPTQGQEGPLGASACEEPASRGLLGPCRPWGSRMWTPWTKPANYSALTLTSPVGSSLWVSPLGLSTWPRANLVEAPPSPQQTALLAPSLPLPSRLAHCPSPAKMDAASPRRQPHCNVKTHSFRQGQAFATGMKTEGLIDSMLHLLRERKGYNPKDCHDYVGNVHHTAIGRLAISAMQCAMDEELSQEQKVPPDMRERSC